MTYLHSLERGALLALALALAAWLPTAAAGLTLDAVKRAPAAVVGADGAAAKDVRVVRDWEGPAQGGERPQALSFRLPGPCRVTDFWSGEPLGRHEGLFEVKDVPKHSARLLVCEPIP